jgi:hypothetical protein
MVAPPIRYVCKIAVLKQQRQLKPKPLFRECIFACIKVVSVLLPPTRVSDGR